MKNKRMEQLLKDKEAHDLSCCARTLDGDYLLPSELGAFVRNSGLDFCDANSEEWVRSIGQALVEVQTKLSDGSSFTIRPGDVVASITTKFQNMPSWQCVWLR